MSLVAAYADVCACTASSTFPAWALAIPRRTPCLGAAQFVHPRPRPRRAIGGDLSCPRLAAPSPPSLAGVPLTRQLGLFGGETAVREREARAPPRAVAVRAWPEHPGILPEAVALIMRVLGAELECVWDAQGNVVAGRPREPLPPPAPRIVHYVCPVGGCSVRVCGNGVPCERHRRWLACVLCWLPGFEPLERCPLCEGRLYVADWADREPWVKEVAEAPEILRRLEAAKREHARGEAMLRAEAARKGPHWGGRCPSCDPGTLQKEPEEGFVFCGVCGFAAWEET